MSKQLALIIAILLTTAACAQSPVSINLRTPSSSVYHDQPLVLSVSITNRQAQWAQRWNQAADDRIAELDQKLKTAGISKEEYDAEKKYVQEKRKTSNAITIGTEQQPWTGLVQWSALMNGRNVSLPVKVLPNPKSDPVAKLDENGYYVAWFGISPNDMEKVLPGKYVITVELHDVSQKIEIDVSNSSVPAAIMATDSMQYLYAAYYWQANDVKKGLSHAENILQRDPGSVEGLTIKADLLVLEGSYNAALDVYRKALEQYNKQYPGSYEPPEYLVSCLAFVKEKMGIK